MTGNNEATPIIVGGLVADFCFHKDVDLNKTRFPHYATSVSYTHLDVYKRQMLDMPLSHLKICWIHTLALP